jgi:hypothetical protein
MGRAIEEAEVALDNEGEFPTTTDQGEQETRTHRLPGRESPAVSP